MDMKVLIGIMFIFMPPFEKSGVYCFAHVGRSFGRSVGLSVGRSVDQMISDKLLANILIRDLILGRQVGHDQQMHSTACEASRSNFKVTVTFS